MTRIDFHSQVADKIHFTCRLVRRARRDDCNIVVLAGRADLAKLDAALWNFAEQEFLPHVRAGDPLAAQTPVILTEDDNTALPHHQVLINLSGTTPAHFARFERLIEIVTDDKDDLEASRTRYGAYQKRGYPLVHHIAPKA